MTDERLQQLLKTAAELNIREQTLLRSTNHQPQARPQPARSPAGMSGAHATVRNAALVEADGDDLIASDEPPIEYLPFLGRPGYIVRGWTHLVAGYPRTGKTELVVACCHEWLTLGHRILYITEEPRGLWAARLRATGKSWAGFRCVFAILAKQDDLLDRAIRGSEDIVVIDTARTVLGIKDENDNNQVAAAINAWVARLRESASPKTLIVVHHVRKGGGDSGEGIAGGHAFLASVDIAIELQRDPHAENRRVIRVYARLISPPELAYARSETGAFKALGDPLDVSLSRVEARILDVLRSTQGEWLKLREIAAELDDPRPSVQQMYRALDALARARTVERRQIGRERSYRLATLAPGEVPLMCPSCGADNFSFAASGALACACGWQKEYADA